MAKRSSNEEISKKMPHELQIGLYQQSNSIWQARLQYPRDLNQQCVQLNFIQFAN